MINSHDSGYNHGLLIAIKAMVVPRINRKAISFWGYNHGFGPTPAVENLSQGHLHGDLFGCQAFAIGIRLRPSLGDAQCRWMNGALVIG